VNFADKLAVNQVADWSTRRQRNFFKSRKLCTIFVH